VCKGKSKNEYDYFNLLERSILGMEEDETPANQEFRDARTVTEREYRDNGLTKEDMHKIIQHIRVLSI
jgi:hypothetical protein